MLKNKTKQSIFARYMHVKLAFGQALCIVCELAIDTILIIKWEILDIIESGY